jgi:small subunit ribosomal protein S18
MPMKQIKRKARRPLKKITVIFTYKDPNTLGRFMTEQGMILTRYETGLSQKQQRKLSVEVKRARHLALVPFTQTL